ncbi:MAG: hypothetical protein SFV19_14640 [Rhodospirillaceae bacterium]|nr:hypothetical protein [Rhodospirillaceae bacterium]
MSQNEIQTLLYAALSSGAIVASDDGTVGNLFGQRFNGRSDTSVTMTPAEIITHYDFRVAEMRQPR